MKHFCTDTKQKHLTQHRAFIVLWFVTLLTSVCVCVEAVLFVTHSVACRLFLSCAFLPTSFGSLHHFGAFLSNPGRGTVMRRPHPSLWPLPFSNPDAVYPWQWARTHWLAAVVSQREKTGVWHPHTLPCPPLFSFFLIHVTESLICHLLLTFTVTLQNTCIVCIMRPVLFY